MGALVPALLYAIFAALWILVSDQMVTWLFKDPIHVSLANTLKGWLFVSVTALLFYFLLRRRSIESGYPSPGPIAPARYAWPALVVLLAIVAVTAGGIASTLAQKREVEAARLHAIADLKASQINDWLQERMGNARFVQSSLFFAEQYEAWAKHHQDTAWQRLTTRLEQLLNNRGLHAVSLLDPNGKRLWGSKEAPGQLAPPLLAAVELAWDGQVRRVGPYVGNNGHRRMDFVVPLTVSEGLPPMVVLHLDPEGWLYPMLQAWPVASSSGEIQLVRRDGEQIQFLNDLRHHKGEAVTFRVPLGNSSMLAAQALAGQTRAVETLSGVDYRGVPVLGKVRAIPDTDWFLVAKMDRSEIYADAYQDTIWMGLTGILALFIILASLAILRQRHRLALAEHARQAEMERTRALKLLGAFAESSDDAIFAKDLSGRYILCNRAAGLFVGKPVEAVLGRDDRALFPREQAELIMALDRRAIEENRIRTQEEVLSTPQGSRIFLATKGPLRDENDQIIGTFGISRDITESQQAENRLMDQMRRFRLLLDSSRDGIVIIDQNHRVVEANQRFADMLGYNHEDLLQLHTRDFESPQGEADILANLSDPSQTRRLFETRHRRQDGSEFDVEVSVSGASWGGENLVLCICRDISQRKHIESAIRESEARFRALVEQSLAGIYIIQDGGFRYVNPGFAAIFGYAVPEDILGKNTMELVAPEDRERVGDNVRRRVEGEIADIHYVFKGLRRDGSRIDVEVHGRAFDYEGRPAVIGLILDITARKAAEDALRASELRFHDIVNASADWVWEVDAQGRYTYASESVRDLLGHSAADILGKTPFDLMPAGEAQRIRAEFADIAARKAPFRDLENINLHRDGSLRYIQTNGMPILDEAGELLGYRGLDRDVTERKLAEIALRESEARWIMAIESAGHGVWDWNMETRRVFFSPTWKTMLGHGEDEIGSGQEEWSKRVHPEDLPHCRAALERHFRGETETYICEHRMRCKDGRYKWILNRGRVVARAADGEPARMIGTHTDISLTKAAEAEMRRKTEELAERNAELERFNRATVGRELDMIELKKQVNELAQALGRESPYPLAFLKGAAK
ncbi:MAG: PAS domain S-box protein [Pseudomonadota bacterium]